METREPLKGSSRMTEHDIDDHDLGGPDPAEVAALMDCAAYRAKIGK